MSKVYPQLFYHLVWGTKYRRQLLTEDIEVPVHRYVCHKAREYGYQVVRINGIEDHIHVLIELPPKVSVSEAVGRLKGSSSWFASRVSDRWFAWQNGYGAFTVGKRDLHRVIRYIDRQKQHHRRGTFSDDMEPQDDDVLDS